MPKRSVKGSGKKLPLNMRTTAEMREKINRAAGKSGRSLVGEVEHRVEVSFTRDRQNAIEAELNAINRRLSDAVGFHSGIYRQMREHHEMLTLLAVLLHDKDLSLGEHDQLTKLTKRHGMRPPLNGPVRSHE